MERDLAHVWHPCTQMKDHQKIPIVPIAKGEGIWLQDFAELRYLFLQNERFLLSRQQHQKKSVQSQRKGYTKLPKNLPQQGQGY